jgi:hypothetical protein
MPQSNISLWLRFAQQQIAAESYLHDIKGGEKGVREKKVSGTIV